MARTPILNLSRINTTGTIPNPLKPPRIPNTPSPILPIGGGQTVRRIPWGGGSALEAEMRRLFPNWDTLTQNQKAQIFEQWQRGQNERSQQQTR